MLNACVMPTLRFSVCAIVGMFLYLIAGFVQAETHNSVTVQLSGKHQFLFAGYYAAIEQGYYAEEGLDVRLQQAEADVSPIDKVLSGRAHFGIEDSRLISARLRGEPVVLLANIFKSSPRVVITRPEILRPGQLRGKRILFQDGELATFPFSLMLSDFGLAESELIKVYRRDSISAFADGDIDAMTGALSGELFEIRDRNIPHNVTHPSSYGINAYDGNLFTSESILERNPELVNAFVRATLKGWRYALGHKVEVVDLILSQYSRQFSRERLLFEAQQLERLTLRKVFPLGSVDLKQVESLADVYLASELSADRALLNGFVHVPLSVPDLTKAEADFIAAHPVVQVGVSLRAPLSYRNQGNLQGYTIDYLQLLASKLGIKLEFKPAYLKDRQPALSSSELDLIADRTTPVSGLLSGGDDTYLSLPTGIAVGAAHTGINSLGDLHEGRVGVVQGLYYETLLLRHFPNINVVTCANIVDCMTRMASGSVDAVMDVMPVLKYNLNKYVMPGVRLLSDPQHKKFRSLSQRFVVRGDWPLLRSALKKAAASLKTEEVSTLQRRWLNSAVPHSPRLQLNDWERAYLKGRERIRYCIDANALPYEGLDGAGQHTGISAEYRNLFETYLNIEFQLVRTTSWEQSVQAVMAGRCDLLLAFSSFKKKPPNMLLSKTYLSLPLVLATHKQVNPFGGINGAGNQLLAVASGSGLSEFLKSRYPEANLLEVNELDEGFNRLISAKVYGVVDSSLAISRALQNRSFHTVRQSGGIGDKLLFTVALSDNEPHLYSIINKVIEAITPREHTNILNRWIAVAPRQQDNFRAFMIAALLCIPALLFWGGRVWQRRNARTVRAAMKSSAQEAARLDTQDQMLVWLSENDSLSGLYNRTRLSSCLQRGVAEADEFDQSLTVMLVDIDGLGRINERYGRSLGDSVLRDVARLLKQQVSLPDIVGRWGGKQFLIISPQRTEEQGRQLAESLRMLIEQTEFDHRETVSVSIGVVGRKAQESVAELVCCLDDVLGRAKREGRNRVYVRAS